MKISTVIDRLSAATTAVNQICEVSGVPGVSVGVIHEGKVVYTANFGHRNVAAKEGPTSKTLYSVGSLTKSFTAAALANLLDASDTVDWTTPVDEIFPDFKPKDDRLRDLVSIGDFLSHRTGLFGDMSIVLQGGAEFLLPKGDIISAASDLDTIEVFREQWNYNNWGYSIAGLVIEKLSDQLFNQYLSETILKPLGMTHTSSDPACIAGDDFAEGHTALHDATIHPLPRLYPFSHSLFESAGGIYSNVDDLLLWGKAVLHAEKNPSASPLKQAPTLLSNRVPLDSPSRDYRFYGMGWIRTQLPGVVGLQGENTDLFGVDELPILGQGSSPIMAYYHQGSSIGYQSAMFLFPETESVVVVLTNSQSLNDAADWISQLYIAALFGFSTSADYVELARESRKRRLAKFDELKSAIDEIRNQNLGGIPRPVKEYVGRYHNEQGNFFIDVRSHPDSEACLQLVFQGKESQVYELRHLQQDVFEWALSYDKSAKAARFPIWDPLYFEVEFDIKSGTLTWAKYTGVRPKGLSLYKKEQRTEL